MNPLFPFLLANWPLSLLALVLILALVVMEFLNRNRGVELVSPQKATILMNKKNCQIIDVRSKEEFEKGHISRSKHYTIEQLKAENALQKNKKDPVVLVCYSGISSRKAAALLKSKGFEQVYSITGGIAEWRKEHLPLIKSEA